MSQNNKPQENQNEDKDLLHAIYGAKAFVKIYQALAIGKIKFSFVNKENTKECIDCYIDADEFACDFIDIIDSGELRSRAARARQEQQQAKAQYAKDVWESRAGISQSGDNTHLRKFTIQPGTSQEFTFRASQGKLNLNIGFQFRELKILSYRWHFLENDWNKLMTQKYTIDNMTSPYRLEQYKKQLANQEAEENNANVQEETSSNASVTSPAARSEEKSNSSQNSSNQSTAQANASHGNSNAHKIVDLKLKVKTQLCDMDNGGKAFQGWGQDNKQYSVVIRKELLNDPRLHELLQKANTAGALLTVKGALVKDNLFYVA